ncbi:MAG TPA: SulP family inorganic anion transporter, partial [Holophagaceae bacterium]|nr:SulP family inorganic anion transporter [Holophagaceae bacterium]
ALPLAGLAGWLLARTVPGFHLETLGTRFHTLVDGRMVDGIPRTGLSLAWPWHAPGPEGQDFTLSLATLRLLLPSAFAVAMLGAIESLLSAVVADGMARTRHDPDAELLALGVGNVLTPFFGGIPATGAIARTATNFRFGGRTPVAAMTHALTILAAMLLLAPLLRHLPMASLAALLLLVAWNMSEVEHFLHTVRVAPRSDVAVLLTCFALTVVFDMVIAVSVGVMLASLLFMRRMAAVTEGRIAEPDHSELPGRLPEGVVIYDLSGPLFFGATERAMGAIHAIGGEVRAVVFRMEQVPAADVTGIVALEGVLEELARQKVKVILVGLQPPVRQAFAKAGIGPREGRIAVCEDMVGAFRALDAKLHPLRHLEHGALRFHLLHRHKAQVGRTRRQVG